MLTWPSLDHWCYQVSLQLRTSLSSCETKAAALHRNLRTQGRPVRVSEGSFQNALTPSTETHQLKLDEFWNVLDLIDNKPTIHAVCRQFDLLVAVEPASAETTHTALFGAFVDRNGELAETQHLLRSIIDKKYPPTVNGSREVLLREIYEDFCESLSLLLKLERVCGEGQGLETIEFNKSWQDRYAMVDRSVVGKLSELQGQNDIRNILPDRIIQAALRSEESVQLSLPNFLKLMFIDKSRNLAKVFVESLGYRLGPLPVLDWNIPSQNLIQSYAELESRQADTAEKISNALRMRRITQAELNEIYQELVDEHQAQVTLVMSSGVLPQRVERQES